MLRNSLKFFLAIALAPALLFAQDSTMRQRGQTQIDTTRIGLMSPIVVHQRLRMLGYSNVTIVENVRAHLRANAVKSGRALAVKYDPYSGKVTEVPGRLERGPRGLRLIKPDGSAVAPPT
jgi:hypothetical protein